jgi:hypothetical protein
MGIRASYTEVTKDQFNTIRAGGNIAGDQLLAQTTYHLDKSWHQFHVVFSKQDHPLDKIIVGNFSHPQSPNSLDELIEGNSDFYIGMFSHDYISEIARALIRINIKKIEGLSNDAKFDFDDYLRSYYNILNRVFHDVSIHGNALYIVIS